VSIHRLTLKDQPSDTFFPIQRHRLPRFQPTPHNITGPFPGSIRSTTETPSLPSDYYLGNFRLRSDVAQGALNLLSLHRDSHRYRQLSKGLKWTEEESHELVELVQAFNQKSVKEDCSLNKIARAYHQKHPDRSVKNVTNRLHYLEDHGIIQLCRAQNKGLWTDEEIKFLGDLSHGFTMPDLPTDFYSIFTERFGRHRTRGAIMAKYRKTQRKLNL
jgi:hypothetical protein